ncbi:MAG: hypothetical protein ACOYXT_20865 [Bacteroidota bacterium]
MNWKLIFQLSLFGLAMAFVTVWLPSNLEPFFWLFIFVICAYLIAKKSGGKYFLHGFLVSLVNSVWITTVHVAFFNTYIEHHPEMLEINAGMPMSDYPRRLMVLMGPVFGAFFGLILGLFSLIAGKLVTR